MSKAKKSFPKPAIIECIKTYKLQYLLSDLTAGLTVGVVALPLAIAFAIASGANPQQGLWTGIIAGVLIALFGGSRSQINGPTGSFVPILLVISSQYGYKGLALATLLSGIILISMGVLRLGSLIKFIPYPVITGFTSGAAVIIFVSQLKEFFGLTIELTPYPIEQIRDIATHLQNTNPVTLGIGILSLGIMLFWPKKWKYIPASIGTIIFATIIVFLLNNYLFNTEMLGDAWIEKCKDFKVTTIFEKFGNIPSNLPAFSFPEATFDDIKKLMGPAMILATLGAIESLLSAMVSDSMMGKKHDSNQELIGQGIANFVTPFFGGIPATGGLARTATNIRAGAKTPLAGIIHALVLLLFVLFAAPIANHIPLVALSAVLLVIAFRMGDWKNFSILAKTSRTDFCVFFVTFSLTIVLDLSIAVGIGLLMSCAFFVKSMEEVGQVRLVTPESEMDISYDSIKDKDIPKDVLVFRMEGAFFFGVVEKLDNVCSRLPSVPMVVIFRMRFVPAIDATGLQALKAILEKFRLNGTDLILSGVQAQPMKILYKSGFVDMIGLDNIQPNLDMCLIRAQQIIDEKAKKQASANASDASHFSESNTEEKSNITDKPIEVTPEETDSINESDNSSEGDSKN